MSPVARGVALSVLASVLFGAMYYLSALLAPLNGEQIFGWRMVLTVPLLALFLRWGGDWQLVRATLRRLRQERVLWLVLPTSAALLGVQLWLFLWAPPNGRALEVSLGYFMLPLSMVLTGRFLYGERLTRLQQLAVGCAVAGVLHELWRVGHFSWPAAVVVIGYPLYFVLRRRYRTDHLGGLWFDLLFMLPLATAFALTGEVTALYAQRPLLGPLLLLLGCISAGALVSYILSSRLLPLGLFGLLGYVEPILLVAVALLLGERMADGQAWTYGPIWLAVGLLVIEGLRRSREARSSGS